jgi:hypothetical protein
VKNGRLRSFVRRLAQVGNPGLISGINLIFLARPKYDPLRTFGVT